jgi:hypothetical protein
MGASHRERKRQKVSCPECNAEVADASLKAHMQTQHGKSIGPTFQVDMTDGPEAYRVSFPKSEPSIECPVESCRGRAINPAALRLHFAYRHPHDTVVVLEAKRNNFAPFNLLTMAKEEGV